MEECLGQVAQVYLADGLVETNFFLVLSYGKIWQETRRIESNSLLSTCF